MKTRTKKFVFAVAVFFFVLVGLGGTWLYLLGKYAHRHCIQLTGLSFHIYSGDHQGQLPYSTNGFGNALLILAKSDCVAGDALKSIPFICGPGDDGHVFAEAVTNNSVIPEDQCSRVYIQGLSDSNDGNICILFDRNSCRGGDHNRSPWGHRVRETCLLDGSMQVIRDEDWPLFSRKQVDLLVAAGFSRTNALHFYPAAE